MSMKMKSRIVRGVGEEGCKLRSPSGVNTMDDTTQAAVFVGIMITIGLCTSILNAMLSSLTVNYEWFQSFRYSWPIVLGLFYTTVGVTHFTHARQHKNIVPYRGAWGGLWKVPGSAEFHVAWTGVVEVVGGMGLLTGGLINLLAPSLYVSAPNIFTSAGLQSDCAAALYVLTWAVTPANVYSFTHGAKIPIEREGDIAIWIHVVRFAIQVVFLGCMYQMGEGTFAAIFG
jgi:uncharacterized membrane protein